MLNECCPGRDPHGLRQYLPFRSEYLLHGYKLDDWYFEEIDVSDDSIAAVVSIRSHYPSPNGFHLAAPVAFVVLAQLAIIKAHVDLGAQRKEAEVVVTNFNLSCRRMITSCVEIPFLLTREDVRTVRAGHSMFSGTFEVGSGAFNGRGDFAVLRGSGDAQ